MHKVPLVGTISCGEPIYMDEERGDSELLNKYLELIQDEQVGVLFDKVGKLTPKQLKAVLTVIDAIDKEED